MTRGRTGRIDQVAWIALTGSVLLVLGFSVGSALNYSSVVVAHATVYVVPQYRLTFEGKDPSGNLLANGSLTVSLALVAENPSDRVVRFRLVAYGGWIRDGPAEDGWNDTRRQSDAAVSNATGTQYFFQMFTKSLEVAADPVPARGNATAHVSIVLNRTANPTGFEVLRNITAHAVAWNESAEGVPWNHWVRVDLMIDGVPEPDSPSGAAHLRDLRRIEREAGRNLAR